jgi:hypothetical protein
VAGLRRPLGRTYGCFTPDAAVRAVPPRLLLLRLLLRSSWLMLGGDRQIGAAGTAASPGRAGSLGCVDQRGCWRSSGAASDSRIGPIETAASSPEELSPLGVGHCPFRTRGALSTPVSRLAVAGARTPWSSSAWVAGVHACRAREVRGWPPLDARGVLRAGLGGVPPLGPQRPLPVYSGLLQPVALGDSDGLGFGLGGWARQRRGRGRGLGHAVALGSAREQQRHDVGNDGPDDD